MSNRHEIMLDHIDSISAKISPLLLTETIKRSKRL